MNEAETVTAFVLMPWMVAALALYLFH